MKTLVILAALSRASFTLSASDAPKSPDQRIIIELIAEAPDIVTPTGVGVDAKGRVLVIESHTHFRPKDYKGPERDRVLMFTPQTKGKPKGKAKRSIFYEGLNMGMDIALSADGWVYLAERSRILRVKDSTGDGKADKTEDVIVLKTTGTYPHNGLSGLSFNKIGHLVFGLGENLGHAYTMLGSDGAKIKGAAGIGGGVFRCTADGKMLTQIARGFWNPFGTCVDPWGRIFAVDNDPGNRPPCRLLHVVQDGDYGYRYKYGRTGHHPFLAWNGELLGTLPMITGTGEAPCEILFFDSPTFPQEYRGRLLITSWGDHRIESYTLKRKGTSVSATMAPLIQGGDSFRPVGLAMAPDGSLYLSDWGSSSYNPNKKGRLWRIRPIKDFKAKPTKKPAQIDNDRDHLQKARSGKLNCIESARSADPFIRHAGIQRLRNIIDLWSDDEVTFSVGSRIFAHADAIKLSPLGIKAIDNNRRLQPRLVVSILDPTKSHKKKESTLHNGGSPGGLIRIVPGPLVELDNSNTVFELLRRVSDLKRVEHRPLVEKYLTEGDFNYRIFRAGLACLDELDGRDNPDRFNEKFALPLLAKADTSDTLRGHVLRYVPDDHKVLNSKKLITWLGSTNAVLRREAIWKMRHHLDESSHAALRKLALNDKEPLELRLAATAVFGTSESPDSGTLLEIAKSKHTALRDEALRSLVGAHFELDGQKQLAALDIPAADRALGKPFIKNPPEPTDTAAWLKRLDALKGKPDVSAGERIFFNHKIATCANCHQVNERGTRVGPDLTHIGRGMTRERLLESILQPNKEVSPYLRTWVITMKDGKTHSGIAMRRGGNSEVYLGIDGKEIRINKQQIKSKLEGSHSLMPPGLARTLTLTELRDLLAFLSKAR